MAQYQFQAEVSKLLHLIIHSLYSNKEIFLRELISNASDALEKLKYLTVADDAYKVLAFDPRIDITFSKADRTLTVSDNGIGMNMAELSKNLGVIASSGTKAFLEKLGSGDRKASNLIGQFGVGFYSAFMVARGIEVVSKKALDDQTWQWTSDGVTGYDVKRSHRDGQGTDVIVHLTEEGMEFANRWTIEDTVKRYSNHVPFPIFLKYDDSPHTGKNKEAEPVLQTERINSGAALWRKPKKEITEDDYIAFFRGLDGSYENRDAVPLLTVHTKAEGALEYTTLFFVPAKAPADMYRADYKPGVKLYVKRVLITDSDKDLLPTWLRFVKGIVDSEDLPLNVSREILQQNKILTNITSASTKKLLAEFTALAQSGGERWETFVSQYNRPLKEGLYSDWVNRASIIELIRFKSTVIKGWTGLRDYTARMKPEQKYIYYITGGQENTLRASPLLEAYKEKGLEVLILDDEIDDIIMAGVGEYSFKEPEANAGVTDANAGDNEANAGKGDANGDIKGAGAKRWELKAVNRAGADEELGGAADKEGGPLEDPHIIDKVKKALESIVQDVRFSKRLHDSPSCIVAGENDPTPQMAQMLKAMGRTDVPDTKPILELNAAHPLVLSLAAAANDAVIADSALVLLDQALLLEGTPLPDAAAFIAALNRLLTR
jgi:molecular chaperone HtpG